MVENRFIHCPKRRLTYVCLDWEEAFTNVRAALGLPPDTSPPPIPGQASTQPSPPQPQTIPQTTAKRKTTDAENDMEVDGTRDEAKRSKTEGDSEPTTTKASSAAATDPVRIHAQTAASFIPFLETELLLPPKMPSHDEMETVLLQLRKKALVEEYFGEEK